MLLPLYWAVDNVAEVATKLIETISVEPGAPVCDHDNEVALPPRSLALLVASNMGPLWAMTGAKMRLTG